jgi:hypothetical protein
VSAYALHIGFTHQQFSNYPKLITVSVCNDVNIKKRIIPSTCVSTRVLAGRRRNQAPVPLDFLRNEIKKEEIY